MVHGETEHEELALEARKMIRERRFTEADEFISREMLNPLIVIRFSTDSPNAIAFTLP